MLNAAELSQTRGCSLDSGDGVRGQRSSPEEERRYLRSPSRSDKPGQERGVPVTGIHRLPPPGISDSAAQQTGPAARRKTCAQDTPSSDPLTPGVFGRSGADKEPDAGTRADLHLDINTETRPAIQETGRPDDQQCAQHAAQICEQFGTGCGAARCV